MLATLRNVANFRKGGVEK